MRLGVKVVVVIRSGRGSAERRPVRPLDVQAAVPAGGVLIHGVELLSELVKLCKVVVGHRTPGPRKRLLKMLPTDLAGCLCVHSIIPCLELISSDGISNCGLGGSLAQLGQVCTTEALGLLSDKRKWDIRCNRGLLQRGLQDALPGRKIRQRDVDELIQAARPQQSLIEELRPIGRANEEHILLHTYTINLRQELVHHPVTSTASIATSGATGRANGIQLVEEQHAWCCGARLVKDLTDVGLTFAEPHCEQLRPLDAHEVRGAFTCHRLGEQGLAATWRPVEQHTARWLHAELLEFLGVIDRIQDHLLQAALGLLQTPNVVPLDVRHLDHRLTQR
mmetsp:Transcript_90807/g.235496  ORF Transcript_90807/g.235496 Transcript_90807/m.235496 type:complete len:335 (-) Transcript_90807:899-1903(-)